MFHIHFISQKNQLVLLRHFYFKSNTFQQYTYNSLIMSQKIQKKINTLINSLINKGLNNKNVWINKSASSYGLMDQQTIEKLQIQQNDSNLNLIIFVSSKQYTDAFQFKNKQKNIIMTNSEDKVFAIMDQTKKQNGNRNTFVYVSSITNYQYTKLDELYFLDCVTMLLKEFTGRVILQINPSQQENFNENFKNFINYFSKRSANIQFLEDNSTEQYVLCDSNTGKTIQWKELIENTEQKGYKNENNIKVYQKAANELKKERTMIVTKNVMQTRQLKKQNFKLYQNNQINEIIQKIRDDFDYDYDHPELEKILLIYKESGIILCQLQNFSILKATLKDQNICQTDYQDSDFTENYTDLQSSLARYIVRNPKLFPIIITDSPLYFLVGRQFSYGNLEIQSNFYQTKPSVYTLQKMIFRNNNSNDNELKYINTLTNKGEFLKNQKYLRNFQAEDNMRITEYPLNLQRRFKSFLKKDQKDQIIIEGTKYYGKFVEKALDILLLQQKQSVHLLGSEYLMNRALWVSQAIKRKVSGLHQIIELGQRQKKLSPTKNRLKRRNSQTNQQTIKIILTKKPTSQQENSNGYMSPKKFDDPPQFETKQSWNKRNNDRKLRFNDLYCRGQQKKRGQKKRNK